MTTLTLKEIRAEQQRLERLAQQVIKDEASKAVSNIVSMMVEYGISMDDIAAAKEKADKAAADQEKALHPAAPARKPRVKAVAPVQAAGKNTRGSRAAKKVETTEVNAETSKTKPKKVSVKKTPAKKPRVTKAAKPADETQNQEPEQAPT